MIEQETIIQNPFPGLRPFETSESLIFFGRDGLSDVLLGKLRKTRFVAVVGTSGSGKSSLVRAGLLPALHGGFMVSAGSNWRIALFRPVNNPIGNLAQALFEGGMFPAEVHADTGERMAALEEMLRSSSLGLIEIVRQAKMSLYENLLIVVDQFEELYRFEPSNEVEHPKEEAAAFVKLLLEATLQADLPIYIILTMRSDYLGESAQFWGLPEAINKGQFLIPRMDDDERREAIIGPAKVCGATISLPLVNRLLNDAGDNPDQLPILQHALMRTWEYWQNRRGDSKKIDIEHYDNEEVGGMARALSLHADQAYEELTEEQKVIAEKMFKRLTEKGAGIREGRLPGTVAEIEDITQAADEDVLAVIEAFRKEGRSFLMPPAPKSLSPDTLIDISHESLIRGWDRLKTWVEEEADSARIYMRLVDDALRYPKQTGLLRDPELQIALDWRDKYQPNETWAKRYHPDFNKAMSYLDDSKKQRDIAESNREKQRRKYLTYAIAAALIFLTLSIVALGFYRKAEIQRQLASRQGEIAKASELEALEARNLALDAKDNAEIERLKAQDAEGRAVSALATANSERQRAEAARKLAVISQQKAQAQAKIATTYAELGKLYAAAASAFSQDDKTTAKEKYKEVLKTYKSKLPGVSRSEQLSTSLLIGDLIMDSVDEDFSHALDYYNGAIDLLDDKKDQISKAELLIKIGDIFSNAGSIDMNYMIASSFYQQAVNILKDDKNAALKATALVKTGEETRNLEEATKLFRQALAIYQRIGDKSNIAFTLSKMGDRSADLSAPNKALEFYNQAIDIYRELKNHVAEADTLTNIGSSYFKANVLDKALDFYIQADKAYRSEEHSSSVGAESVYSHAFALERIGIIYQGKNDKQQAVEYYEQALSVYRDSRMLQFLGVEGSETKSVNLMSIINSLKSSTKENPR